MRTLLVLAIPALVAVALLTQGGVFARRTVGVATLPPGQESAALALLGMGFIFIVALRLMKAR
jgi:hypothetical protein